MSNGTGLSNLGIALTVLFILSLFALLAQLFYVLHRRRSLLRQIPTTTTTTVHGGGEDGISKEQLLYFFCLRTSNLSRVEPSSSNGSDPESEIEVDMLKVQVEGVYGPSRVLCTIKEGEREGAESADEKSAEKEKKGDVVVAVEELQGAWGAEKGDEVVEVEELRRTWGAEKEKELRGAWGGEKGDEVVAVEELRRTSGAEKEKELRGAGEGDEVVVVEELRRTWGAEKEKEEKELRGAWRAVASVLNTTPFSTPCASPQFLTPSGSLTEDEFKSLPL